MSRKLWKPLAAIAAFAALVPAHAQMRNRAAPDQRPEFNNASRQQGEPPRLDPRPQPEFFQPGRLSPEERRQLRRDIHDAGRELYGPDAPRHRGR